MKKHVVSFQHPAWAIINVTWITTIICNYWPKWPGSSEANDLSLQNTIIYSGPNVAASLHCIGNAMIKTWHFTSAMVTQLCVYYLRSQRAHGYKWFLCNSAYYKWQYKSTSRTPSNLTWVEVFRTIFEFSILRLTFLRKSDSKYWIKQIIIQCNLSCKDNCPFNLFCW